MMLLEEYDAEQVKEYWKKEEVERTLIRVGNLEKVLLNQKKYDELEMAAENPSYRLKLFERYGI